MVLSYSAIAQPSADTPKTISIVTPSRPDEVPSKSDGPAGPSSPAPSQASPPSTTNEQSVSATGYETGPSGISGPSAPVSTAGPSTPGITHLILDAGPLLSLTPLRHLASSFHTTPLVLAELRDPKAREHWERLGLSGVDVRVEPPKPEAMAKVVAFAKKTGDFAVLSQTDLSVIALTYQYEAEVNGEKWIRTEPGQALPPREERPMGAEAAEGVEGEAGTQDGEGGEGDGTEEESEDEEDDIGEDEDAGEEAREELDVEDADGEASQSDVGVVEEVTRSIEQVLLDNSSPAASSSDTQNISPADPPASASAPASTADPVPQPEDPESESDGGEWITPSNLPQHRSRDLGLVTPGPKAASQPHLASVCMTGDFAVQNVLLAMGLGLVGEGGKRIGKVKSWVLRCHACFKLCKDPSKRFCPSCGNPTLLRTTVTTTSSGVQRVHLKKNFQYHLRGTKFSIPDAKPGRAKGQQKGGSGLILREDQMEWQDAVRRREGEVRKEEKRAKKGALEGWNDPDWLPEIITVGMSGKGRQSSQGMPSIGHGRRNPNQARRKR